MTDEDLAAIEERIRVVLQSVEMWGPCQVTAHESAYDDLRALIAEVKRLREQLLEIASNVWERGTYD